MKYFPLFILSVFFLSCQQKENKSTQVPTSDSIVREQDTASKSIEENQQIGDTILMNIKNDEGLFIAEGSLDSLHPKVYVKFRNENLGELNARIIPTTGKGNIRFNQIIFPDESSDGPFGMDLKIPLSQKGNHILVIGHSLMADNPFWGEFKVQVKN